MSVSKDLHNYRKNYHLYDLTEDEVSLNPLEQFSRWFDEASKADIIEPNSMILSTATLRGKPSARVVLLKNFDANGFEFYTNYLSRKGRELTENNQAALLFFWDKLERQVRIEGLVHKADPEDSDKYFVSRPYESQVGAIASEQSREIPSRQYLEKRTEEVRQSTVLKRPKDWGGFILQPDYFEFWQGRPNRLHDRLVFQLAGGQWHLKRLAP